MKSWLELSVVTKSPPFAEEALLALGALSVSFRDAGDDPQFEPRPGQTPLWQTTRTIGLFPSGHDLRTVEASLREMLPDGKTLKCSSATVKDRDWVRVGLRDMKPMRFGKNLWICPQHRTVRATNAVVVKLDPGLAFGTGNHPTTALCLEWLSAQDLRGKTVLDYGCGSGILAIAALKLGAKRAVGVDLDPQALIATVSNARQNRVAKQLSVCLPTQFKPAAYDLVLANILANPLIELAPRLSRCVKSGGDLVMAGLLSRQAKDVSRAYRKKFLITASDPREDWVRLHAAKVK